jgi:hypothetical protein
MIGEGGPERDLAALVLPQSGRLVTTGNRYEPYRLLDPDGAVVEAATAWFRDLLAAGRAASTVRSYGLDLLRWFTAQLGLDHHGYKQTKTDALGCLVDHLLDEAPWLDCTTHEQAMRRSHDIFDAVIAAMTARAAALGQTLPPTEDDMAAARAEGWIVIPDKPITALL